MKLEFLKKNTKKAFYYLAGINRPINPAQVTKLSESILKLGVIRPVVIAYISFVDGIEKPYIIDGQHLFNALIRNNMDIPYVVIHIKDKADLVEKIALLNASSKNWTMLDYVSAWSSLNQDYVKLNHYFQVYDIDLSTLATILMSGSVDGSSTVKKIKSGAFKISDEAANVTILDNLTDMLKVIPRMGRNDNRYAIREYTKFLRTTKNYNHKKFLTNLSKKKDEFILATQEDGKLVELFTKLK